MDKDTEVMDSKYDVFGFFLEVPVIPPHRPLVQADFDFTSEQEQLEFYFVNECL